MRYAVCLFLLLCSCQKLLHTPVVNIHPEFKDYVTEFLEEGAARGRPIEITDLIVEFSYGLNDQVLGECFTFGGYKSNTILINSNRWLYKPDEYRRVIMFHELGHCVLDREHELTGRVRGGYCTPTSIMWPYVVDQTNMYVANWNEYMIELFLGAAPGPECTFNNYWGG